MKCRSQQPNLSNQTTVEFFFQGAPTKTLAYHLPVKAMILLHSFSFNQSSFDKPWISDAGFQRNKRCAKNNDFLRKTHSSTRFIKASRSWPGFFHHEALIALSLYLIFRIPDSRLRKFPTPFSLVEDDGAFLCY